MNSKGRMWAAEGEANSKAEQSTSLLQVHSIGQLGEAVKQLLGACWRLLLRELWCREIAALGIGIQCTGVVVVSFGLVWQSLSWQP